jgi:hypothetical protein
MIPASRHLVLHASIVLLFGLLLGAPFSRAIKSGAPAHIVNSWRVAHLSLPLGATLMFAVAALLPAFAVLSTVTWLITGFLIVSAYSFAISTPLAAMTGERGLASGGIGLGKLVYAGNLLGAITSLMAAIMLVYAAAASL